MIITEPASRYAKALFNLTSSEDQRQTLFQHLSFIEQIINQPKISYFISSPEISLKEKISLLRKHFPEEVNSYLYKFLSLLIKRKRIKILPEIVRKFHLLLNESSDTIFAKIITATELDQNTIEYVKQKLNSHYQKNIELSHHIDPFLIGGGILSFGHSMIDFSIKNKLSQLKKSLLSQR